MIIRNEDIKQVIAEIPEGHRHIRTTVVKSDGTELIFQEATIANIVRAYIQIKTHPVTRRVKMTGREVSGKKDGYAEWQLTED